ncbi:MAG: hypothetical protein JSW27_15480 [Phycisphaerales bacterium]|nr:MAG: hypothetical protein JSW27_15480 [Phycisphaerales bacterium]
MKNPDPDNLKELFERFMPPSDAETAAGEVHAGEDVLRDHPAPQPRPEIIVGIKLQINDKLAGRHRTSHSLYRIAAAAAAVIVVALIGYLGRAPQSRSNLSRAALIPTAIWESDDIASDDFDIAYFASEIQQIEAQVRALEAGEGENTGAGALDEVEMELMQINAEFWKE